MKKGFITAAVLALVLVFTATAVYASEITIRKSGSIWITIDSSGNIRENGSIVGQIDGNYVRKNGSIVGEIDSSGTIRKNGSIVATYDDSGYLRKNGSIVGQVESSGYIRKNGSIWGEASGASTYTGRLHVAAILIFYSGDF